jgi:hypothetical protein
MKAGVLIFYGLYVLGLAAAIIVQVWWTNRKRRRKARGFPVIKKSSES